MYQARTNFLQNNNGFTLAEVMVAFVILIVGLLGLLTAVNVALVNNVKNAMRDEVTKVAARTMSDMRARAFNNVSTITVPTIVQSKLRGMSAQYSVKRTVENLDSVSRQYKVDVQWTHKGETFTHSITSIRSQDTE